MYSIEYGGLNLLRIASLKNKCNINWLGEFPSSPFFIWNIISNFVFDVNGLQFFFFLLCEYSFSKLPIKLSNFHSFFAIVYIQCIYSKSQNVL